VQVCSRAFLTGTVEEMTAWRIRGSILLLASFLLWLEAEGAFIGTLRQLQVLCFAQKNCGAAEYEAGQGVG
jgi:hypothetical protein